MSRPSHLCVGFAAIALAIMAASGAAQAGPEAALHPTCVAPDMASPVDFGADGKPLYFVAGAVAQIVREARSCRFRKIALTLYSDGADRAVVRQRVAVLKAMLVKSHWPRRAIETGTQPLRLAPSGTDRDGAWTAKAMIGFADPDPGFTPPTMQVPQSCRVDPQTNVSQCEPYVWPPRSASRMPPPPPPYDPKFVLFGFNQARFIDRSPEMVAEGIRIFHAENFRRFVLYGQAGPDETDGPALALRRAAVVRDELIRQGVDPRLIVVERETPMPATEAVRPEDLFVYRRVTIDYED